MRHSVAQLPTLGLDARWGPNVWGASSWREWVRGRPYRGRLPGKTSSRRHHSQLNLLVAKHALGIRLATSLVSLTATAISTLHPHHVRRGS